MSHYDTLGVSRDASPAEIKTAWRRASAAAHPDREGGSTERQQAVNRAYEVLSDAERRAAYAATGSDEERPSLEQEAQRNLVTLFSSLMDADGDLLVHASDVISDARQQLVHSISKAKGEAMRLSNRRGKIRRKEGAGDNLFEQLLDARIGELDAQIKLMKHGLKVNAEISRLLATYESDAPAPTATPTGAPGSGFNSIAGLFQNRRPWRKA